MPSSTRKQNIGLWEGFLPLEDDWGEQLNENFRRLDMLVQLRALSVRALSAPPGGPADGALYVVGAAPTGLWAGQENMIARWWVTGAVWEFITPRAGWECWSDADSADWTYTGSTWTLDPAQLRGSLYGYNKYTTTGLTWGFWGGVLMVNGVPTTIADGTVLLTNAATNYVEADAAGAVTDNTTGFTPGRNPLYTVVTAGGLVTGFTDLRPFAGRSLRSRVSKSVAGASNVTLTRNEADADLLVLTGVLTGNITVFLPAGQGPTVVMNNTTGAFSLTVSATGGAGTVVSQGAVQSIASDGTNVRPVGGTFGKFTQDLGDGTATAFVVTHNLNTQEFIASVRRNASPYDQVLVDVEATTVNTATIRFAAPPTSNQYRVAIIG